MICKYCGENECLDGLKYCALCKEWHKKFNIDRKNRLKESGLCVSCGHEQALENLVHCGACREKNASKSRVYSERRKKNNLCNRCHVNKCESGRVCDSCKPIVRKNARESKSRLDAERRSLGICVDCKTVTNDPSSSGRCLRCQCYSIRHILNGRAESSVSVDDLVEIWNKQSGVCALTGLNMKLADAELDHITPIHIGGPSSIENLRWVIRSANRAKGKMTDAELIEMCRLIVNHLEKTHG